jgi:CheY-like chemotaxis protein
MNPPVVLLVDNADEDVCLIRLALLHRNLQFDLRQAFDGREGTDYLNGTSQYSDRETFPFPAVTIVKTQLPLRSGFDVLAWVRRHPRLKDHTVVLLNDAPKPGDSDRAAQLKTTRYFEKSTEYRDVADFLETLLRPAPAAEVV